MLMYLEQLHSLTCTLPIHIPFSTTVVLRVPIVDGEAREPNTPILHRDLVVVILIVLQIDESFVAAKWPVLLSLRMTIFFILAYIQNTQKRHESFFWGLLYVHFPAILIILERENIRESIWGEKMHDVWWNSQDFAWKITKMWNAYLIPAALSIWSFYLSHHHTCDFLKL